VREISPNAKNKAQKVGRHVDMSAGQIDYLPVFFSHKREDGLRFSAGVKIKL
jgi:hypothetical protein